MIALTSVYVLATIVICYFSYCAAKASKEQTKELQQQFLAENRPIITTEVIFERRRYYGLRLTNHGRRVAKHVIIEFDSKFINSIIEPAFQQIVKEQNEKECIIGIGQHYDLFFGTSKFRNRPQKAPILFRIKYSDADHTFEEEVNIDFTKYATFYSTESDADDIKLEMKKMTHELKKINTTLSDFHKQ